MGYQSLPASGTARLTLTQLSSTGKVLATNSVSVALPATGPSFGAYLAASTTTSIRSTTTTLRVTVSPVTGLTLLADELFLRPA